MAGHIERKEIIYMLILVSFVFGVFYFYKGQYYLHDMFRGSKGFEKTHIIHSQSSAKRTFQKNMEATLNDMLKGVFDEMNDYRKRRKILTEIIKPANLRNPQYITESYTLAGQTIPDLQTRSNRIIKIFEQKDAEINRLIKERPVNAQQEILKAWDNIKRNQVNLYVQYFAIEQNLLAQHQALIALYHRHKNEVTYDRESNQATFKQQTLNTEAAKLYQNIRNLKQKQAALTK